MKNSNYSQPTGTTTVSFEEWGLPVLIKTEVYKDRVELIYKQSRNFTYTGNFEFSQQPCPKIFKVIYSCKNGKWHESKKIKGQYISASEEAYEF